MTRKLIGKFVCTLLIATTVLTVVSLRNSTIIATVRRYPLARMGTSLTEMQKPLILNGVANALSTETSNGGA